MVHDLINDFFMDQLYEWINLFYLKPIFRNSLFLVGILISNGFQVYAGLHICCLQSTLSLFFSKVKQCSKWVRRQQHIMHAVFEKAEKTLFPLIIFLDLIVLTYNLSSLISAIDYANTSMSVWKMLHVVMPLSYIYIVEKSPFVAV